MIRKYTLELASAIALCFAVTGSAYAQSSSNPLTNVVPVNLTEAASGIADGRNVYAADTNSGLQMIALNRQPDLNYLGAPDFMSDLGNRASIDTHLANQFRPAISGSPFVWPGTLAIRSAPALHPSYGRRFSVEPGGLPWWVTDQPLAYLRYGAAPVVLTLHFRHK